MTDRKIYKRRKLHGLKAPGDPQWAQLGDPEGLRLSDMLNIADVNGCDRLFLCGSLEQMSREFVEEPLQLPPGGWKFGRQYVHKYRSPVYEHIHTGRKISVKLVSESWFPDCEDMLSAIPAWRTLKATWEQGTSIPLLSTPAASGRALLWETLPKDEAFPALPDDLAKLIRRVSPQHRVEVLKDGDDMARVLVSGKPLYQYDGRWMYASLATLDRLPIGEPVRVEKFEPYAPGWYRVQVSAPSDWKHIGLIPFADGEGDWVYPVVADDRGWFETWASEPELTLALKYGWKVEVLEGWAFTQGRPLGTWARKLIVMREHLLRIGSDSRPDAMLAASAIRNVLNHTIGSLHVDGFEREQFVSDETFREWFQANRDYIARGGEYRERAEQDGVKGWLVRSIVPDDSPMGIYMPHWSATIWALERARVTEWALKCDPNVLVKIHGDAIYSTAELPLEDKDGRLGQPRRKQ